MEEGGEESRLEGEEDRLAFTEGFGIWETALEGGFTYERNAI